MDTKISPQWTTVTVVGLLLAAATTLALSGQAAHVDALIAGAIGFLAPNRGRVSP